VSPTVLYDGKYRFFFFSREEKRMHVHIHSSEGEAKFWLDPIPTLVESHGLSAKQLNQIGKLVEEHLNEIKRSWEKHFGY
jgi:Domain of unknown function (DUF4160)